MAPACRCRQQALEGLPLVAALLAMVWTSAVLAADAAKGTVTPGAETGTVLSLGKGKPTGALLTRDLVIDRNGRMQSFREEQIVRYLAGVNYLDHGVNANRVCRR